MSPLDGAMQWWRVQWGRDIPISISLALLALAGAGFALAPKLRGRGRQVVSLGCVFVASAVVVENVALYVRASASLAIEVELVGRVESLVWGGGDEQLNANLRTLRELGESHLRRDRAPPLLRSTWASVLAGDQKARAERAFVTQVRDQFVAPALHQLEARLAQGSQGDPGSFRRPLKVYLMLTSADHVDVEWITAELTELNSPASGQVDERVLINVLRSYVALVRRGRARPLLSNAELVDRVRAELAKSPHPLYDALVERSPGARDVTLRHALEHEPEKLALVRSGESSRVDGVYTSAGRYHVRERLRAADAIVDRESWVAAPRRVETETLAGVERDFDLRCVQAWKDWIGSLRLRHPADVGEAVLAYKQLTTDDTFVRIFSPALTHTTTSTLRRADTRTKPWTNPGVTVPNWPPPQRPGEFFAELVWFAEADDHRDVRLDWHVVAANKRLTQYEEMLDQLREELEHARTFSGVESQRRVDAALDAAADQLMAILAPYSSWTRSLLCARLLDPLLVAGSRLAKQEDADPGARCTREGTRSSSWQ